MKRGRRYRIYDEPMVDHVHVALNERQHRYLKAKAKVDRKTMADIVRLAIDKAYEQELRNGIDIIRIAEDHGLI